MEDSTLRKLLVAWVIGFAFALVLVERWRRMGLMAAGVEPADGQVRPRAEIGEVGRETEHEPPSDRIRRIGTSVGQSVVKGVKSDIEFVREKVSRRRHAASSRQDELGEQPEPTAATQ